MNLMAPDNRRIN